MPSLRLSGARDGGGLRREPPSDHQPDDRADDCAGRKIGEPMDRHGHPQPDVKRINQRRQAQPPLFGDDCEHRDRHGKGDGGVRRRPAPESAAAQEAKTKIMADVRAHFVHGGMNPAGEHLVGGGNERAEEFRLANGPADAGDPGVQSDITGEDERQRQEKRHKSTDRRGRKHPFPQQRTPGGGEIKPVKPGLDQDERENDSQQVPEQHPPTETADDVAGQGEEELLHAVKQKST